MSSEWQANQVVRLDAGGITLARGAAMAQAAAQ